MTRAFRAVSIAIAFALVSTPVRAFAQAPHPSLLPTPKVSELLVAGVIGLLPLDRGISEEMGDPGPQHSTVLRSTASVFNRLGDPGTAAIALVAWGTGAISGSAALTDFGWHATEAIAMSSALTAVIKGVAGRVRPNGNADDADDFRLGGGFSSHATSFPSGHTTAAFALAATLAEETRLHDPQAARYVTPLAYGAAGLVGLSRIYSQRHWASDVVVGAAIGTYTARRLFHKHHGSAGAAH